MSWHRAANVIWNGTLSRLTAGGLVGEPLPGTTQVRSSLATLTCALGVFLVTGVALWAQLTIGWQWSPPGNAATSTGEIVMTAALGLLGALLVAAGLPVAWLALTQAARHRSGRLVRPLGVTLLAVALLVLGSRHFGNGWPGTGGHPWAHQGLVPGGVAAFTWALTLSVSSYWAHPGALQAFPASEVVWMVISPLLLATAVGGTATVLRRLELSERLLGYELRLARGAWAGMIVFFVGACLWVVDGGPGPRNLFHTGAVDIVGLAVMVGAAALAFHSLDRARRVRVPAASP